MYTTINFKTKKALKEAVAAGREVSVYQINDIFGAGRRTLEESRERPVEVTLEGPHYPEPHRWYARATVVNGKIVRVI